MFAVLALSCSVLWGSADYLGGKLSKRFPAIAVTGVSQAFGLLVGLIILLFSRHWIAPNFHWNGYLLPGIAAGLVGFVGLCSYYVGLSTGRMGVVAPLSALSAVIPLIYAFTRGEKPSSLAIAGMVIALLGAFCASGPEVAQGLPIRPLLLGLLTAICFGTALVFMAQGSKTSAIYTMTTMRFATVSICALLAIKAKSIGGFESSDISTLIAIGSADFLANFTLGVATTRGLLSVAMVLGNLFPVVTVLLAYKFLHERLHKIQYLGVFFAVLGVCLIALG